MSSVPVITMAPIFLRARDAAAALGISVSQFQKFVRAGTLTPIRLPGIRRTVYSCDEISEFAARIRRGQIRKNESPAAGKRHGPQVSRGGATTP